MYILAGPGLVFIVFPTAISKMPFPHLWSVLFFLTLLTVAFDSEVRILSTHTYINRFSVAMQGWSRIKNDCCNNLAICHIQTISDASAADNF